jgi:ferredoxin
MKAYIDKDGCIACGVCVAICPAVFQIGADGLAEVYMDDIPESFMGSVEETMDSCPVSVITIE